MGVVGNVIARVGADTRPFQQGLRNAQRNLSSFQNGVNASLNKIKIMQAAIVATLGLGIREISNNAMNYEASLQRIAFMFGNNAADINKWANNNAAAFNVSRLEATQYAAVYGNLLMTFAKDTKQLTDYTTQLLEASAIVASATGRDMQDVMERMRSGLLGNTEAIEDLGVSIFVNMIEGTKAFQRFSNGVAWKNLSFQTQQQIRLFAILEQVNEKFGTSLYQNTKTRLGVFTSTLKNAALNIGIGLLPVINAMLPALTNMAIGFERITQTFANFMQLIFGYKLQQTQNNIATKKASSAQDALGNSVKKAGKKVSDGLQGFDELNILQKEIADGADDVSDAVGGGNGINTGTVQQDTSPLESNLGRLTQAFLPLQTAVEGFKNALLPLQNFVYTALQGFYNDVLAPIGTWILGEGLPKFITITSDMIKKVDFTKITEALTNFYKSIAPFSTEIIGQGALWFYKNVLSPIATYVTNNLLPPFLSLLGSVINILGSFISANAPWLNWLYQTFLVPLGKWTGGVVAVAIDIITKSLKGVSEWCKEHQTTIAVTTGIVALFFAAWKGIELMAFAQIAGTTIIPSLAAIRSALYALTIAKIVDRYQTMMLILMYVGDFLRATMIAVKATWLYNAALMAIPYVLAVAAIAAIVGGFVYLIETNEKVRGVLAKVVGGFSLLVNYIWNAVIYAITSVGMAVYDMAFSGAKVLIDGFINPAIRGFNTLIDLSNRLFKTSFNKVGEIKFNIETYDKGKSKIEAWQKSMQVQDIENKALAVANQFDEYYKNAGQDPNSIANKINGLISSINKPELTNPDSIVIPQGTSKLLNLQQYAPEMESYISKQNAAKIESQQQTNQKDIVIQLDGQELGRLALPYLKKEEQRQGTAMIAVY